MKRIVNSFVALAFICTLLIGSAAAQQRSEREIRDAVRTLNSQIDDLFYDLDFEVKNNAGGSYLKAAIQGLDELADKVVVFEENLLSRRENFDDVNQIIASARRVDTIFKAASANRAIEDKWTNVKRSVDSLAKKYNGSSGWNSNSITTISSTMGVGARVIPPPTGSVGARQMPAPSAGTRSVPPASSVLNGTYDLDITRSENVADAILNSNVAGAEKVELENKLEAPQQISIQVRGNQVTLSTSKAPQITFVADGRERTETAGGKTIRLRATMRGQDLVISTIGDETDYTVTFSPVDNGRSMKVTRRVTTEYINETIFAESIYNRSDISALPAPDNGVTSPASSGTDTYSSTDPNENKTVIGRSPSVVTPRIGEFIIPNRTVITGLLENPIDTKVSQNNDRFRMTVQSPDQFRGAIVEGFISGVGRSGQVSGRSNVTFNFTKITLRDGKEYDFAGTLQSIRDAQGKDVKVDAEGIAKSDSQTKETMKRGGLGAGLGAIIGAIAGGGKGAAIGAIIGGGAGAGSVAIQGREDVKLQQGSVLTVMSSSPTRRDPQVSETN